MLHCSLLHLYIYLLLNSTMMHHHSPFTPNPKNPMPCTSITDSQPQPLRPLLASTQSVVELSKTHRKEKEKKKKPSANAPLNKSTRALWLCSTFVGACVVDVVLLAGERTRSLAPTPSLNSQIKSPLTFVLTSFLPSFLVASSLRFSVHNLCFCY